MSNKEDNLLIVWFRDGNSSENFTPLEIKVQCYVQKALALIVKVA